MLRVLIVMAADGGVDRKIHQGLVAQFPDVHFDLVQRADQAQAFIGSADVLMTLGAFVDDEVVKAGSRLRWIQALGSGVDGIIDLPSLRKDILVTSGRGAQALPVSETALALMFALSRDLPRLFRNQQRHHWERWSPGLLSGKMLAVVGVGAIAEALAAKCGALGMRVIGVSGSREAAPGFERLYPVSQLQQVAQKADFLVVLSPYSAATRHLISEQVISVLRPSAYLVNVARGAVVEQAALINALEGGRLAGAALDVFETEPLPRDSRLWSLPNVIISPHLGGVHEGYAHDLLPILTANLRAFLRDDMAAMCNIQKLP
ncbi:MAG: D-2-hydroxyacid dehydrogenase [Pseudomonadota bacterium]|nr:D-2-hydroxyacid dehydrogenase [Pseudomonadota bacterium]